MTITFIDGDSIAYAAGYNEHPAQMEQCCDMYIRDITNATQCSRFEGFVETPDGKANFRKHVAVTRPYKANRRSEKPPWLVEAKHYLREKWGFKFVTYMESEDAASIRAHEIGLSNSIIAAIDKDLHQIPARFYDYKKKAWVVVTPEESEYNLYKQILTGDSVDNIPGIPGCGPAKAETALSWDGIDGCKPTLCEAVVRAYKEAGLSYEYFLEQARLIYILRRRGEVFTPITREAWESL